MKKLDLRCRAEYGVNKEPRDEKELQVMGYNMLFPVVMGHAICKFNNMGGEVDHQSP